MAVMLLRLAYPSRLFNLQLLFRELYSTICVVFNTIYDMFASSIRLNRAHFDLMSLLIFSHAVRSKGSPYHDIVGFIDGTLNATCGHGHKQSYVYNGHHKQHGIKWIKWQSIVTPDGITVSLCGPFTGSMHVQRMLDESNILPELKELLDQRAGSGPLHAIYGDPAYTLSDVIARPFQRYELTDNVYEEVNRRMSKVRQCVEWEFGKVGSLFAFLKYRQQQKLYLNRVGHFYAVATLMKNVHCCINGGTQTSKYF